MEPYFFGGIRRSINPHQNRLFHFIKGTDVLGSQAAGFTANPEA